MCVLCAFSLKLMLQLFIWLVSISQSGGPLSYLCWLVALSDQYIPLVKPTVVVVMFPTLLIEKIVG